MPGGAAPARGAMVTVPEFTSDRTPSVGDNQRMSATDGSEHVLAGRSGQRISRVGWTSAIFGALITFVAVGFFIPLIGATTRRRSWGC